MITTKPIRHWMQKDYYLPKILPFFLSFYDMNYEYEYKKKTREIQMTLDISNMPNLLKNNLGNTDFRKFSKVLHTEDHDKSNLISFNIDKMESLWRPILDFTLVEID
jgi:tRNA U38,U39,U40 pseudouridine synthase TruA